MPQEKRLVLPEPTVRFFSFFMAVSSERDIGCMKSGDLITFGFVSWHRLNRQNEKSLLAILPSRPGVYAMRGRNPERITGSSDLVYFGKTTNSKGLKQRIAQYFHPGPTQRTNHRLLALFGSCDDFELSFVSTSEQDARPLETKLIAMYRQAHGTRPLWNKRWRLRKRVESKHRPALTPNDGQCTRTRNKGNSSKLAIGDIFGRNPLITVCALQKQLKEQGFQTAQGSCLSRQMSAVVANTWRSRPIQDRRKDEGDNRNPAERHWC
jgi:hypothetical protein